MAKHYKFKKTLFFIAGSAATEAEIAASLEFEPGVQFRNASKVEKEGSIEAFDRLAGAIPDVYQAVQDKRDGKVPEDSPEAPNGAETPAIRAARTGGFVHGRAVATPAPATGAAWGANA